MRGSDFIFDCVNSPYQKGHEINLKCSGSYIGSPGGIKKKKAKINPGNDDDKCFLYAAAIPLNCDKIESNSERVPNIKPFLNNYNLKGIHYLPIIALNVL